MKNRKNKNVYDLYQNSVPNYALWPNFEVIDRQFIELIALFNQLLKKIGGGGGDSACPPVCLGLGFEVR